MSEFRIRQTKEVSYCQPNLKKVLQRMQDLHISIHTDELNEFTQLRLRDDAQMIMNLSQATFFPLVNVSLVHSYFGTTEILPFSSISLPYSSISTLMFV